MGILFNIMLLYLLSLTYFVVVFTVLAIQSNMNANNIPSKHPIIAPIILFGNDSTIVAFKTLLNTTDIFFIIPNIIPNINIVIPYV